MYSKLWNVVRMLLVLSHGQAAVERGFSINKQYTIIQTINHMRLTISYNAMYTHHMKSQISKDIILRCARKLAVKAA